MNGKIKKTVTFALITLVIGLMGVAAIYAYTGNLPTTAIEINDKREFSGDEIKNVTVVKYSS